MPATLDRPAPTVELVEIARVHKGEPASEELGVQYRPGSGRVPASLIILSGWRKRSATYREADFYHVERLDSPLGRGFRLHRTRRKVEQDPTRTASYGVLVTAAGPQCDCMGGVATARHDRLCKHAAVIGQLVSVGAL